MGFGSWDMPFLPFRWRFTPTPAVRGLRGDLTWSVLPISKNGLHRRVQHILIILKRSWHFEFSEKIQNHHVQWHPYFNPRNNIFPARRENFCRRRAHFFIVWWWLWILTLKSVLDRSLCYGMCISWRECMKKGWLAKILFIKPFFNRKKKLKK